MGISPDTSLGAAVCRICHCGETSIPYFGSSGGEPLISPCHCKGTMGLYHRSCVEHWLNLTGTTGCEICKFRYQTEKTRRSFYEFMKERGVCHLDEGRTCVTDSCCFLVLTPLAAGAVYFCMTTGIEPIEGDKLNPYQVAAMIFLIILLAIFYTTWVGATYNYYHDHFEDWQKTHQRTVVVDQLSPDESLLFNGHRSSFIVQWARKFTRSFRSMVRRNRRASPTSNSASTAAIFTRPESVVPVASTVNIDPFDNRPIFVVSPIASFYAAPADVEYPSSLYSSTPSDSSPSSSSDSSPDSRQPRTLPPFLMRDACSSTARSSAPIATPAPRMITPTTIGGGGVSTVRSGAASAASCGTGVSTVSNGRLAVTPAFSSSNSNSLMTTPLGSVMSMAVSSTTSSTMTLHSSGTSRASDHRGFSRPPLHASTPITSRAASVGRSVERTPDQPRMETQV